MNYNRNAHASRNRKAQKRKSFPSWGVRKSSMDKLTSLLVVVLVLWDHYATWAGLGFAAILPQPLEYWDCRGMLPVPPYTQLWWLWIWICWIWAGVSSLGIVEKIIWGVAIQVSLPVIWCHIVQNLQHVKLYNSPQHSSDHWVQVLEAASVIRTQKMS